MTTSEFTLKVMPLGGALYRIAFYMLESEPEAEDAVQELMLKLWERRDVLDSVSNLSAYCSTLMRNHCIDIIRRAAKTKTESLEAIEIEARENADTSILDREKLNATLRAMHSLSPKQREALSLSSVEGLGHKEIAARMGISYPMVRVLLSQARAKIKKQTGR